MPKFEKSGLMPSEVRRKLHEMGDDKWREVLAKQRAERMAVESAPIDFATKTGAEIAVSDEFKEYCAEIGIPAEKSRVSKNRQNFIRWYNEKVAKRAGN